jgi:hypothetical protein
MKNLAYCVVDRLFIVVYGDRDPGNDEWWGYIEEIKRHGVERTMHLIFTSGGGPLAPQRRYLSEVLAGRTVPVAVISPNPAVRFMVTVMSWFNRNIRAFPTSGLYDALDFLEVPTSRADLIGKRVVQFRSELMKD